MKNMRKRSEMLRIGVAGFGVVGKRRKVCIDNNANARVVAICDQSFSSPFSEEDGVYYFQNYVSLLDVDLDIIFICMPNDIAPEVTIAALQKGIHVFCEKPPGKSVEDVELVIETFEKKSNLKLMYGFNHRFHHSVVKALDIVRSKRLGQIINLRGVYGKAKLVTFNQPDWRTKREIAGGGVLLDQGIHMVDLMRMFAGEFTEVHSMISNAHWKYDVEDNAYALMRTGKGTVALINSSATQWRHRFNLDINLEKGSLILSGILSGTKSYGAETLTIVEADPDNDNGDPVEQILRYNQDPSWQTEVDTFITAVDKDLPIESSTAYDALRTMRLVFKIYYADVSWRTKYQINNPEI